ncbi:UDP-glucose 4-epimerase [Pseudomonas putida S11]|nr:UDP-glucose 4-epimerase [Pseudomonas putida S11]
MRWWWRTSSRPAPASQWAKLDIADEPALDVLFGVCRFDAVFHFASFIQVGESVSVPGKYYQNNVAATLSLLQAMVNAGIRHLVFSSSAAVYGNPQYVPIDEAHAKGPINPYGLSKWMVEQILEDFDRAYGLKSVCLRYFNAAGADPEGQLGERHDPETHLIPLILQAASGRRDAVTVFGRDYDTPDGTCIRDYVHVADLAAAHALAVDYLLAGGERTAFNRGQRAGLFGAAGDRYGPGGDWPADPHPRRPPPPRRPAPVRWRMLARPCTCWAGGRSLPRWSRLCGMRGNGSCSTPGLANPPAERVRHTCGSGRVREHRRSRCHPPRRLLRG